MRNLIIRLGRNKSVIGLTLISTFLAVGATLIITYTLRRSGADVNLSVGIIISIISALLISPIIGFSLIGLIFEINKLEIEMRQMAEFDQLTGLIRREEFLNKASYNFKIASSEQLSLVLILADLDNFKEINDRFGHLAGDQILEKMGLIFQNSIRQSDLGCRWGGDEFVFLLSNCSREQAELLCERLHTAIHNPIDISGSSFHLTASLGLVVFPELESDDPLDYISAADDAMYLAKTNGGNQTCCYQAHKTNSTINN